MTEIEGRQLHLVKKALAIAALAIEHQDGPLKSASDQTDMKGLLAELISSEAELEHYLRAARIVLLGRPD
jgi:transcription elongation GreA/GreB family factor